MSFFHRDSSPIQPSPQSDEYQELVRHTCTNLAILFRDVNLPHQLAQKYERGLVIREKAFTDASCRKGGMVTTHRFVILSNHMADLSQYEHGTSWGLYVAQRGSHFKVLGQLGRGGKTLIFLLHLPDDLTWKVWEAVDFPQEAELFRLAAERSLETLAMAPVPELATREWLNRCAFPVGMDDRGRFWSLEDGLKEEETHSSIHFTYPGAADGQSQVRPPEHDPEPKEPDSKAILKDRFRGCLLGGAAGDALGYPIEFLNEAAIRQRYGVHGIRELVQAGSPALVSDDTQMTLFAANAILYARERGLPVQEVLWTAYLEWLGTQGNTSRMKDPDKPLMWVYEDRRLHACRAPGMTCMTSLSDSLNGGTREHPINNSKGCGTVMRAAPFGLMDCRKAPSSLDKQALQEAERMALRDVMDAASFDAALTHGHPMAWHCSGLLAQLIFYIVYLHPQRDCRLETVLSQLCLDERFPGFQEAALQLTQTVKLALDPSLPDLAGIHAVGEGWVAEEALGIALFCAIRHQDDFGAAIRAAVNHKGDSDSTGAICGNILGAWLGAENILHSFDFSQLELKDLLVSMADRLFEVETADPQQEKASEDDLRHERIKALLSAEGVPAKTVEPLRATGMKYTPLTRKAMAICFEAHKNQRDKSGVPYVFHPFHLAEQLDTEEEICTALLHDVLEDTNLNAGDLLREGFPSAVVEALELLTRKPGEDYLTYTAALRGCPIARRVKLADLAHNSDLTRLSAVTEADRRRALKYHQAQAILADDVVFPETGMAKKRIPLSDENKAFLSVYYREHAPILFSIDADEAGFSCILEPAAAHTLLIQLGGQVSLPEALSIWLPESLSAIPSGLTMLNIPFDFYRIPLEQA